MGEMRGARRRWADREERPKRLPIWIPMAGVLAVASPILAEAFVGEEPLGVRAEWRPIQAAVENAVVAALDATEDAARIAAGMIDTAALSPPPPEELRGFGRGAPTNRAPVVADEPRPTAPTVWNGVKSARAQRAVLPRALYETPDDISSLGLIDPDAVLYAPTSEEARLRAGAYEVSGLARFADDAPLRAARPLPRPSKAFAAGVAVSGGASSVAPAVDAASTPTLTPTPAAFDAGPSPAVPPRATVSLVLTAVGINESATQAAFETLPATVAMAVAPVGSSPRLWADRARAEGRVTLVEIPMQPSSYPRLNPGPLTLLTGADPAENRRRFEEALASAPNVDGVATYLGDAFLRDAAAVSGFVEAAKDRGLFVLETASFGGSALAGAARSAHVPAVAAPVSLDNQGRTRDLRRGLAALEAAALRDGHATGVAVALPSSVTALSDWSAGLAARGFQLVPPKR